MKRIVTGLFAAAFFLSLCGAMAGNAGSSADPFVTKTYVEETYKKQIASDAASAADSSLGAVYAAALKKLNAAHDARSAASSGSGFSMASSPEQFDLSAGAYVTGTVGTEFTLLSGSVTVTVDSGALIDVTRGVEVPSSTALTVGSRYICAEGASVTFRAGAASSCTVSGLYKAAKNAEKVFTAYLDTAPRDWYYPYAKYVYEHALYHDYKDNVFRQAVPTDRATIVYALWRLSGAPSPKGASPFNDLSESWYVSAVTWANENNIVNGYGDGRFGPGDRVTREQIACFMYRFAKYRGRSLSNTVDLSSYTDSGLISNWALEEMKWANKQRLITGVTETTLVPQGIATRAEVAAIIARYAG